MGTLQYEVVHLVGHVIEVVVGASCGEARHLWLPYLRCSRAGGKARQFAQYTLDQIR